MRSNQQIEEAAEIDLSSQSICLEARGLNIVSLYFHSAEDLRPLET